MSDFDPGDAWRELDNAETAHVTVDHVTLRENGRVRVWVRKNSIPPLPTEPYTVIRVTWKPGHWRDVDLIVKTPGPISWKAVGDGREWDGITWQQHITSFEVLSEPAPLVALYEEQRRVARDVLDEIQSYPQDSVPYKIIGRRYGVEI